MARIQLLELAQTGRHHSDWPAIQLALLTEQYALLSVIIQEGLADANGSARQR